MRRLLLAPLLLLAACSMFEGSSQPPAPSQPDAASLVANAMDEAQSVTDKRFSELRATLDQLVSDQARLRDNFADLREGAELDRNAAVAAQAAAASANHLLLITGIVAGLACVATLILSIVVVWQSVLLRRAQREGRSGALRHDEAAERAAMAASQRAPAPASGMPAAAPGGPLARLRRRPPG
jgi:hypothetical protein